jgi:hypothetical protein
MTNPTGGETGKRQAIDRRFGAAGDHHLGVAERDQPPSVADGVRASRTSRDDGVIGAFEPMSDRHLAAGEIDQPAGDEERRDTPRPLLVQRHRGLVDAAETTDARADQYAGVDLVLVGLGRPAGVPQRLAGGGHREDNKVVDLALLLRLYPLVGIERVGRGAARNLCGDLASDVGDVEALDPRRAGFASQQATPGGLNPGSQRRDHAEASDDDSIHGPSSAPCSVAFANFERDKGRTCSGPCD